MRKLQNDKLPGVCAVIGCMIIIYFILMYVAGEPFAQKITKFFGGIAFSDAAINYLATTIINIIIISVFLVVNKTNRHFSLSTVKKVKIEIPLGIQLVIATIIYSHISMIITTMFMNILGIQMPVIENFSANESWIDTVISVVAIVLVGPVAEEYVFRKNIYGKMREALPYNKSMIISSIIWGCLHGSLGLGINAFFMGLVYAAAYERCHTLKWPIALHMIVNCLAVLPAVSNHVNTVYVFFMSNFFAKVPIVFVVTEIYVCCILMKKIFQGLSKSDNTLWENETGERM